MKSCFFNDYCDNSVEELWHVDGFACYKALSRTEVNLIRPLQDVGFINLRFLL